jgi:uncharacterized protein
MMPSHLRPVLLELEARVRRLFAGRRCEVRLFGSYARGEAHEDSDVDVLVLVDGLVASEIAGVADLTFELATETGLALAGVAMATERFTPGPGRRFVSEVERDGERP